MFLTNGVPEHDGGSRPQRGEHQEKTVHVSIEYCRKLLQATIRSLRNSEVFSDACILVRDGHRFSVHTFVVSAHSKVMRAKLLQGGHHRVLQVDIVDSDVMACLLDYMYGKQVVVRKSCIRRFMQAVRDLAIERLDTPCLRKLEERALARSEERFQAGQQRRMHELSRGVLPSPALLWIENGKPAELYLCTLPIGVNRGDGKTRDGDGPDQVEASGGSRKVTRLSLTTFPRQLSQVELEEVRSEAERGEMTAKDNNSRDESVDEGEELSIAKQSVEQAAKDYNNRDGSVDEEEIRIGEQSLEQAMQGEGTVDEKMSDRKVQKYKTGCIYKVYNNEFPNKDTKPSKAQDKCEDSKHVTGAKPDKKVKSHKTSNAKLSQKQEKKHLRSSKKIASHRNTRKSGEANLVCGSVVVPEGQKQEKEEPGVCNQ